MKWQRRRSEHDAAAIPDDHAADSPHHPDDPDAANAGHHPGLRIVPTRLRLNVPSRSRLRINVSPGLQRRRRRRDDGAGQCGGAGASVRPRRDSIAARLQMRALHRAVSVETTLHGGAPRTWWLKDAKGASPRTAGGVLPSAGGAESSSQVRLVLYKKCGELLAGPQF